MNPLVYRITGFKPGGQYREVVLLRFGKLAYYGEELTAIRALAQIKSMGYYTDTRIEYNSGDWRVRNAES